MVSPMLVAGLLLAGVASAHPLPPPPEFAVALCLPQEVAPRGVSSCSSVSGNGTLSGPPYIGPYPSGIVCFDADVQPGPDGTSEATVRFTCCVYSGRNPHPMWCFESDSHVDTA